VEALALSLSLFSIPTNFIEREVTKKLEKLKALEDEEPEA
jgi:hypothetical protein